jgi:hypothetical protein
MKLDRKLGWLLAAIVLFTATETHALTCGPDDCAVAGATNDSPLSVGDAGDFATSVDVVTPSDNGDEFNHAWTFTLLENAHLQGSLTNNNTRPAFNIDGLSLELFSADDLTTSLGDTFVVPSAGTNPFVNFAFLNLAAGDYIFKVSGTVLGSDGQYASQFAVSEVPLPPAVWLLVSALLGLASITRLRRQAQPAQ